MQNKKHCYIYIVFNVFVCISTLKLEQTNAELANGDNRLKTGNVGHVCVFQTANQDDSWWSGNFH